MSRCQPSFRRAVVSPKTAPRGGFTLVELLVCMGLLGVISTVLIALAMNSTALVSAGASSIELNQRARSAVTRMAPYLATAISSTSQPALITPRAKVDSPTAADLVSYQTLRFNTTEDFLAPGYNPSTPWNPAAGTCVYEFTFEETAGQTFTTEGGTAVNLGRVVLRRVSGPALLAVPEPRVIAHNVQLFRCYAIGSYAVEVVINTVGKRKHTQGNNVDVVEEQNAVLSIPSGTYQF